jgi:hypothetical protein
MERRRELSRAIELQKGLSWYLLLTGIVVLLVAPFLVWQNPLPCDFSYCSVIFASSSLIAFPLSPFFLILYIVGVVPSIFLPVYLRKPIFFQGALAAFCPLFLVIFNTLSRSWNLLTPGVMLAFLGSILLEASYFSYRKNTRREQKSAEPAPDNFLPTRPRN